MRKMFYVCSYGGSGSYMLHRALRKYGNIRHIHSRNPPNSLEYIGNEKGGKCYKEWFNGIKVPEEHYDNYYVIYIYRNPIKSILSRFTDPLHLQHIQTDDKITIDDVINEEKDLYGIKEFFNNYTQPNSNRNYKIYCIKYEDIFDKKDEISKLFQIGNLNIVKKETDRSDMENKYYDKLYPVYKDIIESMNRKDFITIV